MSKARTIQLEAPAELHRALQLIRGRHPHLDQAEFTRLVMLAQAADGYRIFARELDGRIIAVMGYRILHDLAHGSHLHVDDLAFEAGAVSELGELLRFAEGEARRLGLAGLRLRAESDDPQSRKFFENEGWNSQAASFRKPVANH